MHLSIYRSPNTGTPCEILAAASGLHGARTIFLVERGVAYDGARVLREVFKSESLIQHVASFLACTATMRFVYPGSMPDHEQSGTGRA